MTLIWKVRNAQFPYFKTALSFTSEHIYHCVKFWTTSSCFEHGQRLGKVYVGMLPSMPAGQAICY